MFDRILKFREELKIKSIFKIESNKYEYYTRYKGNFTRGYICINEGTIGLNLIVWSDINFVPEPRFLNKRAEKKLLNQVLKHKFFRVRHAVTPFEIIVSC